MPTQSTSQDIPAGLKEQLRERFQIVQENNTAAMDGVLGHPSALEKSGTRGSRYLIVSADDLSRALEAIDAQATKLTKRNNVTFIAVELEGGRAYAIGATDTNAKNARPFYLGEGEGELLTDMRIQHKIVTGREEVGSIGKEFVASRSVSDVATVGESMPNPTSADPAVEALIRRQSEVKSGMETSVKIYNSPEEFDPRVAINEPDVAHIIMKEGKPYVFFDPRQIDLSQAVAVQKTRPVITLVNTSSENLEFRTLEDGPGVTRAWQPGQLLNLEVPPVAGETLADYTARVNALESELKGANSPADRLEIAKKKDINLFSPPEGKFRKAYQNVPKEMPDMGIYSPNPEPRVALQLDFPAVTITPEGWWEGKSFADAEPGKLLQFADPGAMFAVNDSHIIDAVTEGNSAVIDRVRSRELGNTDAYWVAGKAKATYDTPANMPSLIHPNIFGEQQKI